MINLDLGKQINENLTIIPTTRYQGSKRRLLPWFYEIFDGIEFESVLDGFGGSASTSYLFKLMGKSVFFNDILRSNYQTGIALIENASVKLEKNDIKFLLSNSNAQIPSFITDTFEDIYYYPEENKWLDMVVFNIRGLSEFYKGDVLKMKQALAFYSLFQACIIKRPFNLFHRKNLYIRQAEVERSFGNKTTWDKPFEEWFRIFIEEANQAVFDNGQANTALNVDVAEVPGDYDLVYIDTPYISKRGVAVDYFDFYHFLEGLTMYDEWEKHIDYQSKHRRLKRRPSAWTDKKRIHSAFGRLFERFQNSIIVVSYRSDGIPSETELVSLLKQYKRQVHVEHFGQYKYALSTNSEAKELLFIGT